MIEMIDLIDMIDRNDMIDMIDMIVMIPYDTIWQSWSGSIVARAPGSSTGGHRLELQLGHTKDFKNSTHYLFV